VKKETEREKKEGRRGRGDGESQKLGEVLQLMPVQKTF